MPFKLLSLMKVMYEFHINRVLNVTATDGQHFSDVTPVEITMVAPSNGGGRGRFVYSDGGGGHGDYFECKETGVARRLTETMAKAERNNHADDEVINAMWSECCLILNEMTRSYV